MNDAMDRDVFLALKAYWRGSSAFIDDHGYCDIDEATEGLGCINIWQWCDCVGEDGEPDLDCPTCMGWGGGYACMVHDFPVSATMAEREAAFS